jgi:hypothetical protein
LPDALTLNRTENQMRTHSKLALASLAATMLMAFAVSTASAGRLSTSNQNIRVTFNNLELSAEGLPTDTCHVTLEGSFHSRTITKSVGTLLGYITRVATGSCSQGTTILNATLPWHIRYVGFSGTLPNITLLIARVSRASFSTGSLGFICLAEAEIESNFRREASGGITGVEVRAQGIPLRSGGGFGCPAETGNFRSAGDGTASLLGTTTRITITLI